MNTKFMLDCGVDAVKVWRPPSAPLFSQQASTHILVSMDNEIDRRVGERLRDGTIALLRCDWVAVGTSNAALGADSVTGDPVMLQRQDLPTEAFFSPEEAESLFYRGDRSVLVLSHCWQTARHPDPHGTTLAAVRRHLRSGWPGTAGCALFWDWAR